MNTKFLLITACLTLLLSCKNTNEKSDLNKALDGFSNLKKIADGAEKMEEETAKLLKAEPLSNETLKNILPDTLHNFKRIKFTIGNSIFPNLATAYATYSNNSEEIKLTITDGAGETGSALINLQKLNMAVDFEEKSDTEYKKSITLNGYKAIEETVKDSYGNVEFTELRAIVNDRFLVKLNAKNMSMSSLKNIFLKLDLATLKDY